MSSTGRVFLLTCGVVLTLLLMHQLPTFSINGTESRPVDLLSDLRTENHEEAQEIKSAAPPVKKQPVAKYHPKGVVLIDDYSGGKAGGMGHFYNKLLHARSGEGSIHIAYFGDSFVEGDILTCDLRELLQAKYGGCGPGWVDCGGGTGSMRPTITTKFQHIKENVVVKKPFNNQLQAISQRYYQATDGATLRLTGTKFRPHNSSWDQATLFLRSQDGLTVSIKAGNGETTQQTMTGSPEVQALKTTGTMSRISYTFPHINSHTQLFGVALDGAKGVALDNFSMRGVPGFSLAKIPLATLRQLGKNRPYDLIIIHFGLNVVSESATDAMFRHYTNRMKKVVELMRQAFPEASICIFGVPDRGQRTADGIHTLKGIERLSGFQRALASDCGVAYLDIFQVMGGKDSMRKLVDEGCAAKDYTHLSYKGGKRIATRIVQSIQAGVENYRREHK